MIAPLILRAKCYGMEKIAIDRRLFNSPRIIFSMKVLSFFTVVSRILLSGRNENCEKLFMMGLRAFRDSFDIDYRIKSIASIMKK